MKNMVGDMLQLIPNQAQKCRDAFASTKDYERFRRDFAQAIRPDLEKHREARQKSEEAARHHRVT